MTKNKLREEIIDILESSVVEFFGNWKSKVADEILFKIHQQIESSIPEIEKELGQFLTDIDKETGKMNHYNIIKVKSFIHNKLTNIIK
jgi:hypothetical protein